MTSHRPGGNPYRPYYLPPTINEPSSDSFPKPDPHAFAHYGSNNATAGGGGSKYASRARDIFSDIDYKDYLMAEPSPSVVQSVKGVVDDLLWKYTSVLMAQPFEVAKTILQVRIQDDPGALVPLATISTTPRSSSTAQEGRMRQSSHRASIYDDVGSGDSDLCLRLH
jgi:fusion and transport protein UGO1